MTAERLRSMSDSVLAKQRRTTSVERMAEQYGVHAGTVYIELRKRGIQAASGASKLTVEAVRTIRRRLDNGDTVSEVARDYHIGRISIRNVRDRLTWKWVK